jgi:hypothetical protein
MILFARKRGHGRGGSTKEQLGIISLDSGSRMNSGAGVSAMLGGMGGKRGGKVAQVEVGSTKEHLGCQCNTVECYERWRERWERDRGNAIGMQRRERVMLCGEDSGGESRK